MSVIASGFTPAASTAAAGVRKSRGFHWSRNFCRWKPESTSTCRPFEPFSSQTITGISSVRPRSAPATSPATGKRG